MIDENKLIEELLHNDGITFTVNNVDLGSKESAERAFQEVIDNLKLGIVDLINRQPKIIFGVDLAQQIPEQHRETEKQNEKRLVDAVALRKVFRDRYEKAFMYMHTRENKEYWNGYSMGLNWGRNAVATAPTVDAVEVVRCKVCKERHSSEFCECRPENGYCNDGERKDNEI